MWLSWRCPCVCGDDPIGRIIIRNMNVWYPTISVQGAYCSNWNLLPTSFTLGLLDWSSRVWFTIPHEADRDVCISSLAVYMLVIKQGFFLPYSCTILILTVYPKTSRCAIPSHFTVSPGLTIARDRLLHTIHTPYLQDQTNHAWTIET